MRFAFLFLCSVALAEKPSSSQDLGAWNEQVRSEVYQFFENQVYGKAPLEKPAFLAAAEAEPDSSAMNGLATKRVVTIR